MWHARRLQIISPAVVGGAAISAVGGVWLERRQIPGMTAGGAAAATEKQARTPVWTPPSSAEQAAGPLPEGASRETILQTMEYSHSVETMVAAYHWRINEQPPPTFETFVDAESNAREGKMRSFRYELLQTIPWWTRFMTSGTSEVRGEERGCLDLEARQMTVLVQLKTNLGFQLIEINRLIGGDNMEATRFEKETIVDFPPFVPQWAVKMSKSQWSSLVTARWKKLDSEIASNLADETWRETTIRHLRSVGLDEFVPYVEEKGEAASEAALILEGDNSEHARNE